MPPDRQTTTTTTSKPPRPLLPTLASNRNVRSPVTPKIAGYTKPSALPLSRSSAQSLLILSPHSPSTDSLITPSKQLLVNIVTRRSSRRQSRVENSTNVTPASLPCLSPAVVRPASPASPPKAVDTRQINKGHGILAAKSPLGIAADGEAKSSPGYFARIPGVLPQPRSGPGSDTGGSEQSQSFLRANDASAQTRPKRPPMAKKTSSFYYANGEELQVQPRSQAASTAGGSDDLRSETKFSRVHDGPELQSVFQFLSSPGTMPLPMSNQPAKVFPARLHGPPSPSRESIHLSYRKGASQVIRPSSHRPSILRLPTIPYTNDLPTTRRRSSTEVAARRPSQARTSSLGSIAASVISKASTGIASKTPAVFLSELGLSNSPALGTPLEQVESEDAVSVANDAKSDISTGSGLPLHSPTKVEGPAASARHERKVLDLEISNSSLLAVNRTLEREVRKQKSELRRFRRLSRTGRLSLATTCSSVGGLLTLAEDDDSRPSLGLTDDEPLDEDYLSDAASADDDDALSPGALAERDAKHRAEDERRLQADLSRHRDLLVDSSKMNQSIRRCLDWTDELIREGKKALEYRVRVSDVKLGGRVLAHDDEEEESREGGSEGQDDGLLVARERRLGRGLVEPDRTSWDSGLGLESPGKMTDDASGDKT